MSNLASFANTTRLILLLLLLCVQLNVSIAQDTFPRRPVTCASVVFPVYGQMDTFPCPIAWSAAQQISNDSIDATYPQIAQSGDTIHASYFAGGILYTRSTNNGLSWSAPVRLAPADSIGGVSDRSTGIIATLGARAYLAYTHQRPPELGTRVKLLITSDGGTSWPASVIVDSGAPFGIMTLADTIYIYYLNGTNRPCISRSTDFGNTWSRLAQMPAHAYDIAVDRNGIHMVAELPNIEVRYYRSSDYGTTWSPPTLLSTYDSLTSDQPTIASDGDSTLFVAWRDGKYGSIGGFAAAILSRRSTDAGMTWENEVRHDSLPAGRQPVATIGGHFIFLGWIDDRYYPMNFILYRFSSNMGQEWCSREEHFPFSVSQTGLHSTVVNRRIHTIWIRNYDLGSLDLRIFHGYGDITVTGVTESFSFMNQLVDVKAFPNPFNGATRIRYQLPQATIVDLRVFDILGRQVIQLVNEKQPRGTYDIPFPAEHLSSGLYFARLTAGDRIFVNKIALIK